MTHTQHTPGPWESARMIGAPEYIRSIRSPNAQWEHIAHVLDFADCSGEARANAHLIAAAPDLLAAVEDGLEELQAWRNKFHPSEWPDKAVVHTATRDKMRAAIAKARGEG